MQAGRSAKRQLFLLPGGIEKHLKIKTCSVSQRGQEAYSVHPRLAVTPHCGHPVGADAREGGELHPLAVPKLGDFVLQEREIPSLGATWDEPQWGTHW